MPMNSQHPAVLVVDDEFASGELLRITLAREHEVYTATDGEQGLTLLSEHNCRAAAAVKRAAAVDQ